MTVTRPVLFSFGILSVLAPVIVHGLLKDGATSWTPSFLFDNYGLSSSLSSGVTMVVPLISLGGAYAGAWMLKKLKDEIRTCAVFFVSASAGLLLLLFAQHGLVLALLGFVLCTFSMMAANTLFINLYPLRYTTCGKAATVSGFLNSSAYLGAALCAGITGSILQAFGWTAIILLWLGLAALAALWCCFAAGHVR